MYLDYKTTEHYAQYQKRMAEEMKRGQAQQDALLNPLHKAMGRFGALLISVGEKLQPTQSAGKLQRSAR